jgi:small neutral amino acid transporter SnatA (MarC family)
MDSAIFGISIDSFRIAGGILVVTIAMSMISGKLAKINRTSRKNQKRRSVKVSALCRWRCR